MPVGGWPAVIMVHGYVNPTTYQTNGTSYQGWWQTLANTGEFVVFKFDLRGHGQSQGVASGAYYSSTYVIDVLSARAALMGSELVQAGAIGLWGHSMSGNVVIRALAARPEIPAVSLWAGAGYTYKDLASYRINDRSYVPQSPRPTPMVSANEASQEMSVRSQVFGMGETPPDYNSPFWQAMIPTNFLDGFAGAIQLNHAVDDEVVSVNYSRDLQAILEEKNIDYQFFEYSSGGHNLTGVTFNQASGQMIEFFRKYLKGEG
jgi:pimeloyl-ACP methyl ester carboxylesterase